MNATLYRGYDIETDNGDTFRWTDEKGVTHNDYETEEAAMTAIDAHKRAIRAAVSA